MLRRLYELKSNKIEISNEEIKRLEHNLKLLEDLRAGDIVQYKRELYSHWAIYVGNGKIVHLSEPKERTSLSTNPFGVTEVKIDNFLDILKNSYAYRNNLKDNDHRPLPENEILTRAFSKIGCKYYDIFTNNCEHFAYWCRYNIAFNDQSNQIIRFGSRVTHEFRNLHIYLKDLWFPKPINNNNAENNKNNQSNNDKSSKN